MHAFIILHDYKAIRKPIFYKDSIKRKLSLERETWHDDVMKVRIVLAANGLLYILQQDMLHLASERPTLKISIIPILLFTWSERSLGQKQRLHVPCSCRLMNCFPGYRLMNCCLVAKLCLTLWDPMDCSPLGSSCHGIFQARIKEWVAVFFSRRSSWPRNWTWVSCVGRWILHHWATRETQADG